MHSLLSVANHLLSVVCCLLSAVWCLLSALCCLLFTAAKEARGAGWIYQRTRKNALVPAACFLLSVFLVCCL
jgi:hypothetical protein